MALNEVKVLAKMDHPNIVAYHDSFEKGRNSHLNPRFFSIFFYHFWALLGTFHKSLSYYSTYIFRALKKIFQSFHRIIYFSLSI